MRTLSRFWQELGSGDFAGLDPERTVVLMPVGAIEQHGPHLPVAVDTVINDGLVRRALELAPPELPLLVLPTQPVGRSVEHRDFPGTLTLSAETLQRVWCEIGRSVARTGLRKLVIFNSHGGQIQTMQIVARALRISDAMLVVAVSWPQLGLPDGLITPEETRFGIHAGLVETAMMLALRPELVRMGEARDFVPLARRTLGEFPILHGLGAAGFGWQAQDLHPEGACGNAMAATAETGSAIIEHVATRLVTLLQEVSRFPLASLGERHVAQGSPAAQD